MPIMGERRLEVASIDEQGEKEQNMRSEVWWQGGPDHGGPP